MVNVERRGHRGRNKIQTAKYRRGDATMHLLFVCEYILWRVSLSIDDRRRVRGLKMNWSNESLEKMNSSDWNIMYLTI